MSDEQLAELRTLHAEASAAPPGAYNSGYLDALALVFEILEVEE